MSKRLEVCEISRTGSHDRPVFFKMNIRMISKTVIAGLFMPFALFAQGWKQDFSATAAASGWRVDESKLKLTLENRELKAVKLKGMPCIARILPYDAKTPCPLLQMRITDSTQGSVLLTSSHIGSIQDWMKMRPGLYTIPVYALTKPQPKRKQFAFTIYFQKVISFNEFAFVDSNAPDSVIFTVKDQTGKVKTFTEPAVAGDTMMIEMPVSARPDNLSLSLYQINTGKDWSRRGDWETVSLAGVPVQLTVSPDNPNRYQAVFKLSPVQKGLKLAKGKLIAAINYLGADSNNRGYYYGICPYAIDIKPGESQATDSNLKIYDFGPVGGPAAPGAIVINQKMTHPSFRWVRAPYKYVDGFRKTLDPLMMDWAEISKGRFADMTIKVKPGKYKVVVGLGGANTMCWLNQTYRPLQTKVSVNGKQICEFKGEEKERFSLMDKAAKLSDDLYDTYIAPYLHDIETETDCPQGKLQIRVAAASRAVPLNYVAVYPAEDKTAAQQIKKMQSDRKNIFLEYWKDATPSAKELANLLTADLNSDGGDFGLFARENPYEYIFFGTLPNAAEVNVPLRLLAAPGQSAEGVVLLRTFKELKNTTAKLELNGFPDASVSFIMPFRFAGYSTRQYFVGPNHYMPAGTRDLEAGKSYGYRLGLKVPQDMKQGLYKGQIVFTGNGQSRSIPVEIRVTGNALPELSDHLIAMLGVDGSLSAMKFCREYLGCNTVSLMCTWTRFTKFKKDAAGGPESIIQVGGKTPEQIKAWAETYKKAGFPVKTPFVSFQSATSNLTHYAQGPYKLHTPEYNKGLKLSYELFRDILIQHGGCTGIIADLGGEMGHDTKIPKQSLMDAAKEVFKQVSAIPNVRASYRCNCYATVEQFNPYLQVQGVRGAQSWEVADKITDYGKKKFIYTYSVEGRFLNGVHSWAHGAKGNLREWLVFKHQLEYNEFLTCCGHCGGTFHFESMPAPGNQYVPTVRSDAFRASVIDRQYLRMLTDAMKKSTNREARDNAQAFLDLLKARAFEWTPIHGVIWQNANNPWPGIRLDLMREIIVQLCDELNNRPKTLPRFAFAARRVVSKIPAQPDDPAIKNAEQARGDFQDSHWRDIRTGASWEKQGFPYDGGAWYRKEITIPAGWTAPVLRIGAADEQAWVFCNGKFLTHHDGWNQAFTVALPNVRPGSKAKIAIYVFDFVNMGGIWRSVSLHKNAQDAQKNVNGINLDAGWKFALDPGKRDLNVFELADGPFVSASAKKAVVRMMLIPENDSKLRALATAESVVEIRTPGGKTLRSTKIGPVRPYSSSKYLIDLDGIRETECTAVLLTDGKEFARTDFYRIGLWNPDNR